MWNMWGGGGLCPCASLEGSSTVVGCVHLNSFGWTVSRGGVGKRGHKVELISKGKGGWGFRERGLVGTTSTILA